MNEKEIKETDDALWVAWTTKGHHEQFDIIDIERDSQNGDDIHLHLKDRDGHIYKGIITGIEDMYCFCGYERDPNDNEDWSIHIKECPNYNYKMKVKEELLPSFNKNINW